MNKDEEVLKLLEVVNVKKEEIKNGEKPKWVTNCVYNYDDTVVNIKTISSKERIVNLTMDLVSKNQSYTETKKLLGLNESEEYDYYGFKFGDWINDFKARLNQIELTENKVKLENIEKVLNTKISKEYRDKLELDEIKKSLGL
jgi:hypothetical protein